MTIRKAGLGLEERILDNALEPDNPEEPILDERLEAKLDNALLHTFRANDRTRARS